MNTFHVNTGSKKVFECITAFTAFFAIGVQAYLTTGSIGNLFSYFTILTNLLVAITVTANLIFPKTNVGNFFNRPTVKTSIALYIFIVALVYNTVLRGLVTFNGWNLFVDTLLHVIVPILYIIYWFMYVPKGTLQFKHGLNWIYFPFAYLLYSLIRGAIYGWYPYPFLNVQDFGYSKVMFNSIILIAVFMLSGFALIGLDKRLGKRKIIE